MKGKKKETEKLKELEEKLGYSFSDQTILSQALRHSSCRQEGLSSNERLEFLGDSVLGFLIAMYLFDAHPKLTEGELTKKRMKAISKKALLKAGESINLKKYLSVGKGIKKSGSIPPGIVANAMEALVGAVFLDGGIESAWAFVVKHFFRFLKQGKEEGKGENFKSKLQTLVQKQKGIIPIYEVIKEEGPDHKKIFTVVVKIGEHTYGPAKGKSRKEAEQGAARIALMSLDKENSYEPN